jgi:hypothetical protein
MKKKKTIPKDSETIKHFKAEAEVMYGKNMMPFLENLVALNLEELRNLELLINPKRKESK